MSLTKVTMAVVVVSCAVGALSVASWFNFASNLEERSVSAPVAASAGKALAASPAFDAQTALGVCLLMNMPTAANAAQQVAACSEAIQSRTLAPDQVAFARLRRGAARMALGDNVMATGDYTEALRHYDSAIDPANPDALALYRRGASLDALGQSDRALTDYDEAIRLDPQEPLAYFGRGILLATRKRAFVRAIADFDKVIALQPENVEALIRRGDAYGQLGEYGRGVVDLDKAVALEPGNSTAYVFRGLIQSRRGDDQAALKDYSLALERNPGEVSALVNRAAIHAARGNSEGALRDLDAALAINGNNPLALYNRGYVHFAKGLYDTAILDYNAAIVLDPTMGLAYNNRCLTQAIAGQDLVRALSDCDTALKLMPINPDVRETRGFIYLKLGDPVIAIREYEAVLQVDPNRTLALYGRGLARISIGQTKEGEADRAAARILDPSIDKQFSIYGL
jgi:tetratricopeptide (TPR) repeat protein